MDTIIKAVFALVLIQVAVTAFFTVLPWLLLLAVIVGAVAGAVAGGVMRRQIPPPTAPRPLPPLTGERVRRPRGSRAGQ